MANPTPNDRILLDALEKAVDTYGVGNVLRALSAVCHAKADHLQTAWQDADGEYTWNQAGIALSNQADRRVFTALPLGAPIYRRDFQQ